MDDMQQKDGERIAKYLSRAGICSRRDAEKMVAEGRVAVNGAVLDTPAVKVTAADTVTVDGKAVCAEDDTRLWLYHKPRGLVTSHRDEKGRDTVFSSLPADMGRVISVGRLDLNTEGLLLLTNSGALSRWMELPANALSRRYRVRAFGPATQGKLDRLKNGVTIDGVRYGPVEAKIDSTQGGNSWISMTLREGKNREIRRVLEHIGLRVNRLIRVSYGPFELGTLETGAVREIRPDTLRKCLPAFFEQKAPD